jgi:nicotinate dehydrogenase subunit A
VAAARRRHYDAENGWEDALPTYKLKVNGAARNIDATADTPLLYILRNDLALNGAKFGCGLEQCGACTVIVNGRAVRSCTRRMGRLDGAEVTTLEGIGTTAKPHPLQKAFIEEQAMQCGYCINGMIMTAKAFLYRNPKANEAAIRQALDKNLCRCGSHNRIIRAVARAAKEMSA